MKISLKTSPLPGLLPKILSLIFGYSFWIILAQTQNVNKWIEIPVCFYGLNNNHEIIAPENLQVFITGKRSDLSVFNISQIAVHIDISNLLIGKHEINLTDKNIFLHNKIKLLHYNTSTMSIQITEKK